MRLHPPPLGKYTIFCPFCKIECNMIIDSNPIEIECSKCGTLFCILITTIRHARSHIRYSSGREYNVRVVLAEGESQITFIDSKYKHSTIPMYSSDIIIFYYSSKPYKIIMQVQNTTTKQQPHQIAVSRWGTWVQGHSLYNELESTVEEKLDALVPESDYRVYYFFTEILSLYNKGDADIVEFLKVNELIFKSEINI